MAKFVPNNAGILAMLTAPNEVIHKDLTRRMLRVDAEAKRLCPVDTGRLRQSIRWSIRQDGAHLIGVVGTDVFYAGFVHQGIDKPYIVPRTKKALFWKGARHPVGRVKRSEKQRKGQPFLTNALVKAAG